MRNSNYHRLSSNEVAAIEEARYSFSAPFPKGPLYKHGDVPECLHEFAEFNLITPSEALALGRGTAAGWCPCCWLYVTVPIGARRG